MPSRSQLPLRHLNPYNYQLLAKRRPIPVTLDSYIASLSPAVDMRFNEASGDITNYGALGGVGVVSGTASYQANGPLGDGGALGYNATDTRVALAYNATLAAYDTWTYISIVRLDSAGESAEGRFWEWNGSTHALYVAGSALWFALTMSGGLAIRQYAGYGAGFPRELMVFCTLVAGSPNDVMQGYIIEKGDSAITNSTSLVAPSGNYVNPVSANPLEIGNRGTTRTMDGVYDGFYVIPRELTSDERTQIATLAGFLV